jgi:hypothetical protein
VSAPPRRLHAAQKFDIPVPADKPVSPSDLPADGKLVAYALFAHCFTCSKDLKAIYHISRTPT